MSSAILYIGIVAIWAFVLVPKWLRRSPEVPDADSDADADTWPDAESRTPPRAEPRPEREKIDRADDREAAQDEFGEQAAGPVTARSPTMQSRRRLLTMLLTLTGGAMACFVLKFTPWWLVIPPAGMLGFYLLLLRAAAQADAEARRVRQRAAMAARAREQALAARRDAEVAAARARVVRPEPVAEVIDISARVSDQVYDQYADAAIRAVGD